MKNKNKTLALIFHDNGSGEGPEVYYPGKKGEGERFFDNLANNVELDSFHKIKLEMFTKQQVTDARICGDVIAGEISYGSKRYKDWERRQRRRKATRSAQEHKNVEPK